jgi:hypothetical protein
MDDTTLLLSLGFAQRRTPSAVSTSSPACGCQDDVTLGPGDRLTKWEKRQSKRSMTVPPERRAGFPDEITVRAVKRRPKPYPLLTKPRSEYRPEEVI